VGSFLIGKQKVVLFPTFKKNEEKGKGLPYMGSLPYILGKISKKSKTNPTAASLPLYVPYDCYSASQCIGKHYSPLIQLFILKI
jgi:hypothetical protein